MAGVAATEARGLARDGGRCDSQTKDRAAGHVAQWARGQQPHKRSRRGSRTFAVDSGVLAENLAVANTEDLGTGCCACPRSRGRTARRYPGHQRPPLWGGNAHSESSSEEATDMLSGVGVVGDALLVWTQQLLHGSLVPFDHHSFTPLVSRRARISKEASWMFSRRWRYWDESRSKSRWDR